MLSYFVKVNNNNEQSQLCLYMSQSLILTPTCPLDKEYATIAKLKENYLKKKKNLAW